LRRNATTTALANLVEHSEASGNENIMSSMHNQALVR